MMIELNVYYLLLFLFSVFLAAISQILLKKSANIKHTNVINEYKNKYVITAYGIFIVSAFLTMLSYRGVPLSLGPVVETVGLVYVAILSKIFLKEKISRNQIIGIALIIIGVAVSINP